MKNFQKSPLKKAAIAGAIPIVSFLVAFFSIGCFYRYCSDRLQLSRPDLLPQVLQDRGVTLAIEPSADETETYTLSHGEATVRWVRSFDLDWGLTPTFVAADVDADSQPEIVLTYTASGRFPECLSVNSASNFFNIANDFVVYDFEAGGISITCEIPKLYAMYFSDEYRSFLFAGSPIFTLSAYFAIASSLIAGVSYLGLRTRSSSAAR